MPLPPLSAARQLKHRRRIDGHAPVLRSLVAAGADSMVVPCPGAGCTHLTELAQVLPTAVVQAMAGEVIDTGGQGDERPFRIDRCHALRSDGPAVPAHDPRRHRPAA